MIDYYEVAIDTNIVDYIEMAFAVIVEGDHENLPGEKYDSKKNYEPKVCLYSDVSKWIDENVKGEIRFTHGIVYFEIEDEAMAFKLRWT